MESPNLEVGGQIPKIGVHAYVFRVLEYIQRTYCKSESPAVGERSFLGSEFVYFVAIELNCAQGL